MSISGIQGQLLEVTVVDCQKLKDTEWISRQDPYVCLEYGSTKFRTRTCTDGGKQPVFQEKFVFTLIEGLREINVQVWNSNTITYDDFIGNGKVQLQEVLSRGYDDKYWPLQTKTGRYAGEIKLIMHFANANSQAAGFAPSAPPYATQPPPHISMYTAPRLTPTPPKTSAMAYPPTLDSSTTYPPPATTYPPPSTAYAPPPTAYPTAPPYPSYPPHPGTYPPYPYPPSLDPSAYHPSSYPPPSAYPPPPYPPPAFRPGPPGHYPGAYAPPAYY